MASANIALVKWRGKAKFEVSAFYSIETRLYLSFYLNR